MVTAAMYRALLRILERKGSGTMIIDRSAVNRALAKAIAYKQCGREAQAEAWAAELVRLLEVASILDPAKVFCDRVEG